MRTLQATYLLFCVLIFIDLNAQTHSKKLPNIIYIYADDLGYGELGCYGQEKIKTPNIDRLAREGIRFTNHYTGAPVCAPARCMLLTGKNGGHSYIRGNYELGSFADEKEGGQMPLPEGIFTLPAMMKKAGYVTALCGKWGLGMNNNTGSPLKHGFDYYYSVLDQKQGHNHYPTHIWENDKWDSLNNPVINVHRKPDSTSSDAVKFDYYKGNDYAPGKITEKALTFIHRNKNKPFFLYLPYTLPHLALQAPDKYVKLYIGQFDEKPYYGQNGYVGVKYPFSTYAAMITYLDEQVGIIMKNIKDLGLDGNTIIMFSSDNGAAFNVGGVQTSFFNSVGGLRGLKMDLYEGGIRIPFIARWPGNINANTTTDHVSTQYDLMATLAELTRQRLMNTDGISFLPTLLGNSSKQIKHAHLYFEYPEKGGQVAIRMGDWKAVKTDMRKNKSAAWQLFNLKIDRNETTDVASQHPGLLKQFDAILKKEHQCSHIQEWEFIDPKFNERSN